MRKGDELKSANGKYTAVMQKDGNFVVYEDEKKTIPYV